MTKNEIVEKLKKNGFMTNENEVYLFAQAIEELIYEGRDTILGVEDIYVLLEVISMSDGEESSELKDMLSDIIESLILNHGEMGYEEFLRSIVSIDKEPLEFNLMIERFLYGNETYQKMTQKYLAKASVHEKNKLLKLVVNKSND